MSNNKKKYSSVSFFCPAYQDELNVTKVIKSAEKLLKKITNKYEIIVVEDGSRDNTLNVLKALQKKTPHMRIIQHKVNQGYGAAINDGFTNTKYDLVMYTDGDFQYDPKEFVELLKFIDDYDVVIGYKIKRGDSPYRLFQSKIFNFVISALFGLRFKDINCSMKIVKRKQLKKIKLETKTAFIDVELMLKLKRLGAKIKEVPVHHYPRLHGQAGGVKFKVIAPTIKEVVKFFFRRK